MKKTNEVLTFEEVLKAGNSSNNQRIKGQFIERELHCNVNSMVEFILKAESGEAPFTIDDIENLYSYPEWSGNVLGESLYFSGGSEDDRNTFLEEFDRLTEDNLESNNSGEISDVTYTRNCDIIAEARQEVEDLETEPADIFEWYKVTGWFCEKLKEQGQPVIESENLWGRTCTGQAVLLDAVITRICADLEILEGQANEWKK